MGDSTSRVLTNWSVTGIFRSCRPRVAFRSSRCGGDATRIQSILSGWLVQSGMGRFLRVPEDFSAVLGQLRGPMVLPAWVWSPLCQLLLLLLRTKRVYKRSGPARRVAEGMVMGKGLALGGHSPKLGYTPLDILPMVGP
jgi:hypothetical protein